MSRSFWITIAVVLLGFGATYWVLVRKISSDLTPSNSATTVTSSSPTGTAFIDRLVTDTDNGATVTLATGETVAIRLDTHSGGGYQYSLDSYDQTLLRLTKHETIEPNSVDEQGRPIVGAGDIEQWTFTALKPGTTKVELTNFRSFEPRPTKPTFTLTVVVE